MKIIKYIVLLVILSTLVNAYSYGELKKLMNKHTSRKFKEDPQPEQVYDKDQDPRTYNPNAAPTLDQINQRANNQTNVTYPAKVNVYVPKLYGDLYWQGWVKYFHYDFQQEISAPKSFYENPDFFRQKTLDKGYHDLKDKLGHRINIPGKNYFWAKLLATDNLVFLGSRVRENSQGAHLIENLNTDLIEYVNFDDNASGAIKDLGDFHEGSCLRISTNTPDARKNDNFNSRTSDGTKNTWIICTDTKQQKAYLMQYLIAVKLRRQKAIDDVIEEVKPDDPLKANSAAELMQPADGKPVEKHYKGPDATPYDGYWVLLQDWSDCSLKCGGGTMTQQWMCVPPKNPKAKPCIGESLITKKCNEQQCPTVSLEADNQIPQPANALNLTPIYKALPFSKRPQQYVKCFVKENDVLYKTKEFDPQGEEFVKVPARIIMNTKTIAVYKDDSFNNALFTFNLQDTTLSKSKTDICCFTLTSFNRQFELCGFNNNCGTVSNPIWVNGWNYDFEYFQKKCYTELRENLLNIPSTPDILKNPDLPGSGAKKSMVAVQMNGDLLGQQLPQGGDGSTANAQKELVSSRKEIIEKEVEQNQQTELEKKVGDTQKTVLTALRREINLEDMMKSEEEEKGRTEAAELKQVLEHEKLKKKVLQQAMQQRETNYAQIRETKATQLQMDEIKKEAKVEIKFKRAVLKKKIEEIRNKFKRKSRMIQQQIQLVRSEMAEEIMAANKKGNAAVCKDNRGDLKKISEYCDSTFSDDLNRNNTCKEPDNFCYTCCEGEFGDMYLAQRDDCQSMCDGLEKNDLDNGEWVWSPGSVAAAAEEGKVNK